MESLLLAEARQKNAHLFLLFGYFQVEYLIIRTTPIPDLVANMAVATLSHCRSGH
jgi:hypothetical protein